MIMIVMNSKKYLYSFWGVAFPPPPFNPYLSLPYSSYLYTKVGAHHKQKLFPAGRQVCKSPASLLSYSVIGRFTQSLQYVDAIQFSYFSLVVRVDAEVAQGAGALRLQVHVGRGGAVQDGRQPALPRDLHLVAVVDGEVGQGGHGLHAHARRRRGPRQLDQRGHPPGPSNLLLVRHIHAQIGQCLGPLPLHVLVRRAEQRHQHLDAALLRHHHLVVGVYGKVGQSMSSEPLNICVR
mmetsp:Transcript_10899/g.18617  ORF Transcript_10899/g.18617 Transcript_10899/m.18617 type:complete len:236 (+) Transcript_10899:139-846(+)